MTDPHDSAHDHAHGDDAHGDDHGGHEHAHAHAGGTTKQYLAVFGALCALTLLSFVTFQLLHKTSLEVTWAVMMAVSCMKALLVMLFFMHLKWEASWKYVLTIPATVMALFLIVALVPDVKWRFEKIAGGRAPSEERLRQVGAEADQLRRLKVPVPKSAEKTPEKTPATKKAGH